MAVFAIAFGSLLSLGGFALLIAGIALGGDPGTFIGALFFMALGLPAIFVGVKRLKENKGAQKNAQTASAAAAVSAASPVYCPSVGTAAATGHIREEFDLKDITVSALEKRLEELTGNKIENGGCICYEKDNRGMRQDTFEKAVAYWSARMSLIKKPPFILYIFNNEKDAKDALLDLPCIHVAADSNRLICTETLEFGYYKIADLYEAIIAGDDLGYELWEQAKNSFLRHGGKLKNDQAPDKNETAQIHASMRPEDVKFLREQHVNDEHGNTIYRVYQGPDADTAKEFLSRNPVDKPLYYIVVETPDGNYGRDINGMYKE